MKMDCEGGEYEIIEALHGADALRCISVVLLEWHRRKQGQDPHRLVQILKEAGFSLFFLTPISSSDGMLYGALTK